MRIVGGENSVSFLFSVDPRFCFIRHCPLLVQNDKEGQKELHHVPRDYILLAVVAIIPPFSFSPLKQ
jgi:hypothetical protein